MIKKYKEFINENVKNHQPLKGLCGVRINNKNYDFNVKKIIEFAEKNYKAERIKINDIYDISLFKDIDSDDFLIDDDTAEVKIKGKWKKIKDLDKETSEKFKKDQLEIVMMADLKYPIIITKNDKDEFKHIIDGNHRVKKAKILKKKTIKAYVIPEKDIEGLTKEELKELKKGN
jgi:hypothetical protein